ncbi:MAG TPA: hypothetical protein VFZ49_06740 [Pyrinomonadaceae bacterium]
MFRLVPVLFLLLLVSGALSQELPDKIRGYKVHREKISVNAKSASADASVKVGDPEVVDLSLSGITFELPAEFIAAKQSGKVEMVTFHDLRVNGIKVEPEEYSHPFEFRKGEFLKLPQPVRILLPTSGAVKAAWNEMTESKSEWTVTGRVFVFGKFRKFGFYHKRVVPIDIELTIKNPLNGGD